MKCSRLAAHSDKQAISDLRIKEYNLSNDFALIKPEKLLWSKTDDENIVIAAWDNEQAVSTMRAILLKNHEVASSILECKLPDLVIYPAIALNSVATSFEYRGIGLNQVLRYHVFQAAVGSGVGTIIGPVYAGAPRLKFMEQMGYEFIVPEKCWQNKLRPNTKRILGLLKIEHLQNAINHIRKTRDGALKSFPWRGAFVQFIYNYLN
ncbi:MAG: hypothetical protein GY874_04060 [Desulfobacteraceae bacterium]|nr:hypothetical protein [Desulfobacteraceae bacterium]